MIMETYQHGRQFNATKNPYLFTLYGRPLNDKGDHSMIPNTLIYLHYMRDLSTIRETIQ